MQIGYWRYISIYRHLQRNPDNQLYPLFEYFENWCQDENRHGDFFTAILKSQPQVRRPLACWATQVSVCTLLVNAGVTRDCTAVTHSALGIAMHVVLSAVPTRKHGLFCKRRIKQLCMQARTSGAARRLQQRVLCRCAPHNLCEQLTASRCGAAQFLNDWQAKLWSRFFCLSVYVTMYLNDHQRSAFYESIGLNTTQFNRRAAGLPAWHVLCSSCTACLRLSGGRARPHVLHRPRPWPRDCACILHCSDPCAGSPAWRVLCSLSCMGGWVVLCWVHRGWQHTWEQENGLSGSSGGLSARRHPCRHVIIETNKTTARIFPEVPDCEAPEFWERMERLIVLNKRLIAIGASDAPGPLKALQRLPLLERFAAELLQLFIGKHVQCGTYDFDATPAAAY